MTAPGGRGPFMFNTAGNLLRLRQRDQLVIRADIAGDHVKLR
jgi:hypothetical protein